MGKRNALDTKDRRVLQDDGRGGVDLNERVGGRPQRLFVAEGFDRVLKGGPHRG